VAKTKFMADENEKSKERKSLDDRAKMTELERIRHSCAQAFLFVKSHRDTERTEEILGWSSVPLWQNRFYA
jgi:hypothetical protein